MALTRQALQERLGVLRAQRDDLAAQVYRLEGAILSLEELIANYGEDGGLTLVETPDGPALDLSSLVKEA